MTSSVAKITDARNADGQITHRNARGLSAPETLAQERRTGTDGHHRQSCLREQLYPRRLSVVSAADSLGLAEHAVLAQIHQVKVCRVNSASAKPIKMRGGKFHASRNSLARRPKRPPGFFWFSGVSAPEICVSWQSALLVAQRASGTEPNLLGSAVPRSRPISTS